MPISKLRWAKIVSRVTNHTRALHPDSPEEQKKLKDHLLDTPGVKKNTDNGGAFIDTDYEHVPKDEDG